MIRKLRVRNYKSLARVDLDLGYLNVFIGPNGAGKSNLVDVLRLFSEVARGDLESAVARRGGMQELLWRGGADNFSIGMGLDLRDEAAREDESEADPSTGYMLAVEESPDGTVGSRTESLFSRTAEAETHYIAGKWGEGVAFNERIGDEVPYTTEPGILAVKALGYLTDMPTIRNLRAFVEGWTFFDINPAQVRQLRAARHETRLAPDGGNLGPVLRTLEAETPETYRQITEMLQSVVPQFERIETEVGPDGRVSIGIRERTFDTHMPIQNLSDGTLRLLSYLTILSQEPPPSLLCFEGPEQGIHPEALKHLSDLVRATSQRTQVIITTHSPRFISFLKPDEVFTVDKEEDGKTVFRRATEYDNLERWLQELRLGDIWMYNLIGGWPNGSK